jgi:hypothetical protein
MFESLTAQLFQDDFGSGFQSISTTNWPSACRGGSPSSFNTSSAPCGSASERAYLLSGFGAYITSSAINIPATGYALTFEYSFSNAFSFPTIEIRTGGTCGTTLANTTTLTNTSGSCTTESIDLSAFAGQTIFIRFRSNTSSATFYLDEAVVDVASGGGGGGSCLLSDDFGTAFQSINAVNWPSACRGGSPSGFNTSSAPCGTTTERGYSLSGFGAYITSMPLTIPSTGYNLDFEYSFSNAFSFPTIEIRTGGTCGTSLASSTTLSNTGGVCTPQSINLDAFAGQTIFIRFRSNTSSATFFLDEVQVCGGGGASSGDFKFADNFNDNDLIPNFAGNDGDEACTGCGNWTLNGGATLELVPASGWNGNSNETEAFPDGMANVRYVKLDRNEYIESPTLDLSGQTGLKISFYAKSSSPGSGGGDNWSSFGEHLRLQIWDGSAWITVKDITEGTSVEENKILPALPLNYFCFTAYNDAAAPGNYYYNNTPNVNPAYFHADFKFRVVFEGGFSGAPFAWVDDFTFRADADGYSTMIPCGLSFWNQPAATSYGQDLGTSGNNNAEKGVELELDNTINFPPNWNTEANDGDVVDQVFGSGESERVVFCVLSEQEINFTFPRVSYSSPSIGNQSTVLSIDNTYTGPGWRYYAVEYISCDLASATISEPTDQFVYHYVFEYGNEFVPTFYQLNTSGIETGGGVTSSFERFSAPDLTSTDNCGLLLSSELIRFTGIYEHQQVLLEWETEAELDHASFEIERSFDGLQFDQIASQAALGENGLGAYYNYIDADLDKSKKYVYYRLKQMDQDGSFEYTNTIVIELEHQTLDFQIQPNPSSTEAYLILPKMKESYDLELLIYNNLGQVLIQKKYKDLQHQNHLKIDSYSLAKGIYTIHIKVNETYSQNKRFIKQ